MPTSVYMWFPLALVGMAGGLEGRIGYSVHTKRALIYCQNVEANFFSIFVLLIFFTLT